VEIFTETFYETFMPFNAGPNWTKTLYKAMGKLYGLRESIYAFVTSGSSLQ